MSGARAFSSYEYEYGYSAARFFSSASSINASASCCIDSRRSIEVFWIHRNAAGFGEPVIRLQNALRTVHELPRLQPLRQVRDLALQRFQLREPRHRHLDGKHHVALAERLHEVRHRPGIPGPLHEVALRERGEHQDRRDGLLRDLLGGGDPVEDRHLHIEDDQVRLVLPGQLDRLLPVSGLTDDRVPLFFEHLFEVEADERLVLGDDDAGRQRRDVRLVVVGGGLGRLGGGHGAPWFRAGTAAKQPTYLLCASVTRYTSDRLPSRVGAIG